MLLLRLGMDTDPYPSSSAPQLPHLGGRFDLAGEEVQTSSDQFYLTIVANIPSDSTGAPVCGRTADVRSHG